MTFRPLLVVNLGSSSLKFAVFDHRREVLRGLVDQFGPRANVSLTAAGQTVVKVLPIKTARGALGAMKRTLDHLRWQPVAVVHRLVHGGSNYTRPTKMTASVRRRLQRLVPLAPLHLPLNILAMDVTKRFWPRAATWGVFDTAAFAHLPLVAKTYALPLELAAKYHIQKYGFHGLSHHWALIQAAHHLGVRPSQLDAVTLHLGSGSSMALWRHGRPVETTMGFTPLEGLAMSTRSGDIDPAIPLYLQQQAGLSAAAVTKLLEQQSGLFGLSGLRDMRDILDAAGHPVPGWPRRSWAATVRDHAQLALHVYLHDIRRYLSMYLGLLPTVPVVIFTGAIGQNRWLQGQILHRLPAAVGHHVLTVPTNEEQAIADQIQPMVH